MTRRLWFLREIRRSEREANIIADLPRQYGKPEAGQKRTKAKGQTLNAKMNSTQSVSAFSLSQPRPARQPGGAHHAIKQCHQKQL
jgi:hypothetical protein